ncbi:hypothetical protein LguiB_032658 [Lonicera macranthoides]
MQYLISTLNRLKTENNLAIQISGSPASNPNAEELQQEIRNLQHQLQMAEEQLRIFEPDPLRFTSIGELESCEKSLSKALDRVTERKKFLLSNHLSHYDPSNLQQMNSGVPLMFEAQQEEGENSFRNEAAAIGCWSSAPADQNNGGNTDHGGVVVNGHNNNHQDHLFSASPDPNCLPLRNHSSPAVNDALSHTTNLNGGESHMNNVGGGACQIGKSSEESLQQWHQSTHEFLYALMPPHNSFSLLKVHSFLFIYIYIYIGYSYHQNNFSFVRVKYCFQERVVQYIFKVIHCFDNNHN